MWFKRAADQGHTGAQYNLGVMYLKGQGVPKDTVMAYIYFTLAAESGHNSAIESRKRIEEKMTSVQITKAKTLAKTWLEAIIKTEPEP